MPRVVGFFPIGDFDEQFVVAAWEPDPELIEAELIKMADAFGDWSVPLAAARQEMIEATRRNFQNESDPSGFKWPELEPNYKEEKLREGFPDQILVRTSALRTAATSQEAWFVTEDSIVFNAEALPKTDGGENYGMALQSGSVSEERAGLFRKLANRPKGEGLSSEEVNALFTGAGIGKGKNLPPRPFIGADALAIEAIEDIFIKHLDSTIIRHWDDDIGEFGLGFGSNVTGRFPVRGFTKRGQPILHTPSGPRFGRIGG